MDKEAARRELICILQHAFSGERAAGYAYAGHWRSVADASERRRIREIEEEEWHHRRLVGEMLEKLGAFPVPARERRALVIGRVLGALCHVAGWYAPMYGAGRLESRNVREYEDGARLATLCERHELVECLLTMAEVEWEHERYFRSKVEAHWLTRLVGIWPRVPPKETIRAPYGGLLPGAA